MLCVGVVSDTHIPDRILRLPPALLPALQAAGVELILHAGDIAVPGVLDELAQVAPVRAVRGNRDWALRTRLPMHDYLNLAGVPVVLTHGHLSLPGYVLDKLHYITRGYELERYIRNFDRKFGDARVVVFGHTHRAVIHWRAGRLYFNPGAVSGLFGGGNPSFGLLRFLENGEVQAEIVKLTETGV